MGTTTFSGPIKAGTIKETTGTSLGTNIKNTGYTPLTNDILQRLSYFAFLTNSLSSIE